jgi:hypothetical protein
MVSKEHSSMIALCKTSGTQPVYTKADMSLMATQHCKHFGHLKPFVKSKRKVLVSKSNLVVKVCQYVAQARRHHRRADERSKKVFHLFVLLHSKFFCAFGSLTIFIPYHPFVPSSITSSPPKHHTEMPAWTETDDRKLLLACIKLSVSPAVVPSKPRKLTASEEPNPQLG